MFKMLKILNSGLQNHTYAKNIHSSNIYWASSMDLSLCYVLEIQRKHNLSSTGVYNLLGEERHEDKE